MSRDRSSKNRTGSVNRRDFFKTGAVGAVAGGLLSPARAQTLPRTVGPGAVTLRLDINGEQREIAAEPRVTLLDALRDRLDLTGSKKVCDRGTCGACTVLVDSRPVYACSVLAVEMQGHRIETIESIGTPDELDLVQQAFIDNDASQCGFARRAS